LLQITVLCVLVGSTGVAAGEVYKWVDTDGVTHYSESRPRPPDGAVEAVALVPQGASTYEVPDYRAALEVARDIEASRLERERLRLERQKQSVEQAQTAVRRQREDYEAGRYYPLSPHYFGYLRRPRWPHGHEPRRGSRRWQSPWSDQRQRDGVQARFPGMTTR
jgi:hypothetical protein